ncbi:nucleic acid binding protein [Hippeastrum latent virus]|uniref:RNA silencing suppressor n=1 Tax=Hippeastrum latent virus TaxID=335963 RepID=Q4F973_9VIRU|nr:nucleic acid binding protein [Hippeastrum latent virus]AAZ15111.1 nucleic acid binding protein [Hippeastrum latent virus]
MRVDILIALCVNREFNKRGEHHIPLAIYIAKRVGPPLVSTGTSTYARRRRAASIGRCHRCYRVYPPFWWTTRCDNKTCVPGISYKAEVESYVKWGVAEAIPHFKL